MPHNQKTFVQCVLIYGLEYLYWVSTYTLDIQRECNLICN
jgi:hypothetical protein